MKISTLCLKLPLVTRELTRRNCFRVPRQCGAGPSLWRRRESTCCLQQEDNVEAAITPLCSVFWVFLFWVCCRVQCEVLTPQRTCNKRASLLVSRTQIGRQIQDPELAFWLYKRASWDTSGLRVLANYMYTTYSHWKLLIALCFQQTR